MIRAAAIAWLAVAAGCATKINQAAMGVATDLPPAMLDGVTVQLAGSAGTPFAEMSWPLGPASSTALPSMLAAYTTGDRLPTVDVTVTGTLAGAAVVQREVVVTLLPEQTRFVRLALEQRCIGVTCPGDQTCVEGSCAPILFDLSRALPYAQGQEYAQACGNPMFVSTVDGTPLPAATGACAAGQLCTEGTCYQPDGAPPVPGAGEYAMGALGLYPVP
jgi:hypothetical protein